VDYVDYLESKGVNHRRTSRFNFLWVLDFPLFFPGEKPGSFETAHHPFTQPHPDDIYILQTDPLQVSLVMFRNFVMHICSSCVLRGTLDAIHFAGLMFAFLTSG
jgi:hypothetical protein